MFISILIVVVVIIIIVGGYCIAKSDCPEGYVKKYNKSYHYVISIGGFEEFQTLGKDFEIYFKDKYMQLILKKMLKTTIIEVKQEDVVECYIDTLQSVEEHISIGKIALTGVLALGMKNRQSILEEVVVLKFKYNKEIRTIIFKGSKTKPSRILNDEVKALINR